MLCSITRRVIIRKEVDRTKTSCVTLFKNLQMLLKRPIIRRELRYAIFNCYCWRRSQRLKQKRTLNERQRADNVIHEKCCRSLRHNSCSHWLESICSMIFIDALTFSKICFVIFTIFYTLSLSHYKILYIDYAITRAQVWLDVSLDTIFQDNSLINFTFPKNNRVDVVDLGWSLRPLTLNTLITGFKPNKLPSH